MAAAREPSFLSVWPFVYLAVCCSQEAYDGCASTLPPAQQLGAVLERVRVSDHRIRGRGHVTVVAVSGTRKLVDWMVNVNGWASEPEGVLGTTSNLCHTGYLQVVRRLIEPLATLLSGFEKSSAVLFTGHSSGAAIASLLYAHIKTARNTALAEVGREFSTVHCVVFGAPPISICPLQVPQPKAEDRQESLFLSLLNEEDPIIDADVGALVERYVGSVLAWTFARCGPLSSSTLAAAQRSQAFVLSGTILLISSGPDDLLQVHARQSSDTGLRRGVNSTWTAHRVVVYQERIASLYASMKRSVGSTADSSKEPATAVSQQPWRGDILPRAQACWLALNCAWIFQLVAACMWLAFRVFAGLSIQTGLRTEDKGQNAR